MNKKVSLFLDYHKKYVWSLTKGIFLHKIQIENKNGECFSFYAVGLRSVSSSDFSDLMPILDRLRSKHLSLWKSTLISPTILSNECQKRLEMKIRHLRMVSHWLKDEKIVKLFCLNGLEYKWLKLFCCFFAGCFVNLSELQQEYGSSLNEDLWKLRKYVHLVFCRDDLYFVKLLDKKWLRQSRILNKILIPYYPMVAKPLQWEASEELTENFTGGYLLNKELALYSLQPKFKGVRLIVPSSQDSVWWVGLNNLQSKGFRLDWEYVSYLKTNGLLSYAERKMFDTLSTYMFTNDSIYFPVFVDGRGRIYTRSSLGYTFSKTVRWSLLPLTSSNNSLLWKASLVRLVGGSDWFGWQRSSVFELKEKYMSLAHCWFSRVSKNPPQYLGKDYKLIRYYFEWKRSVKTSFIELDMTASVIQMIFLLLREVDQYTYVNLHKSSEKDRIASYYMYVWLIYKKKRGLYIRQTDEEGLSFIKETLIGCSYGLTKKTFFFKGYQKGWVKEDLDCLWRVYHSLPGWSRWSLFFDLLNPNVPSKIDWVTPLGTRIEMSYLDLKSQRRSLAANLLHSLDSSLVILFCSKLLDSRISFFWVHDALFIQSGLEKEAKLLFYQCLYDLFKECTLEHFWKRWEKEFLNEDQKVSSSIDSLVKNKVQEFGLSCSVTNFTI